MLAGRVDATIEMGTASFGGAVERLNGKIRSTIEVPDVRQRLADLGGVPTPSSPGEMRALGEREVARWKRVVELKNIERQN